MEIKKKEANYETNINTEIFNEYFRYHNPSFLYEIFFWVKSGDKSDNLFNEMNHIIYFFVSSNTNYYKSIWKYKMI